MFTLVELYEKDAEKVTGIAMVLKLSNEHFYLTSFSKLHVDLAAQVIGKTNNFIHYFYCYAIL